jgi:hypothetical protein
MTLCWPNKLTLPATGLGPLATQDMLTVPASTYLTIFPVTRDQTTGTPVIPASSSFRARVRKLA